MRRQTLIVVVIATAVVVATSGTALAKGPESATITGPGIDEPIELIDAGNPDLVQALMRQTGLWYGTSGGSRIVTEPAGELGPLYTLTWINSGPPGDPVDTRTIRQLLYLHAENGPVIHTPTQAALQGWGPDVVGWFTAPDGLTDTLSALGVPLSGPESINDPAASNTASATAPVEDDPVSATESSHGASASIDKAADAVVEGESADGLRYPAVAGFGLIIVLVWAAWRRIAITER